MPKKKTDAAPTPAAEPAANKLEILTQLLTRPEGATVPEMVDATGWQEHSVRGALAGALKKKKRLVITSEKPASLRIYRAAAPQPETQPQP